jgi:hypothetical protein
VQCSIRELQLKCRQWQQIVALLTISYILNRLAADLQAWQLLGGA